MSDVGIRRREFLVVLIAVLAAALFPATPASAAAAGETPTVTVTASGLESRGDTWHYLARYPVLSAAGAASAQKGVLTTINSAIRAEFAKQMETYYTFTSEPVHEIAAPTEPADFANGTRRDSWLTYSVTMAGPRFVSILLRGDYMGIGGAHDYSGYAGLTFDLLDGSRLAEADLFTGGVNYLRPFAASMGPRLVCPQAEDIITPDNRTTDSIEQSFHFINDPGTRAFTLTRTGVTLTVNAGTLLAYACGDQKVTLSYRSLGGVLNDGVSAGLSGTSPLNSVLGGGLSAGSLSLPASANPYIRTQKRFSALTLWTRGFLPYDCLRYGLPCLSAKSNQRNEATAQALTIRELSTLAGADGNPRRSPSSSDPIAPEVDWETLFAAPGPPSLSGRAAGTLNADVITDGRNLISGLLEVKRWLGPATTKGVTAQLNGYVSRAQTLGVRLALNGQLQQAHWIDAWVSPAATDPLGTNPEDVWWVWAGPQAGHVYFARGETGRRQAKADNPDTDDAKVAKKARRPGLPLPPIPPILPPSGGGGSSGESSRPGSEIPGEVPEPVGAVPIEEAPLVDAGLSDLAGSLSVEELILGVGSELEALGPLALLAL